MSAATRSPNKKRSVQLETEDSKLHCSSEWHLVRFDHQCAGIIYSHALRLTQESENYYCSIPQMAHYFNKDERTIASAFHELEAHGFFEVIRHENGKAVNYRPIAHHAWAESDDHRRQCVEKLKMSWDGEGDPLGRALYAISGEQVKFFFPNVLKSFRKHGLTDEDIIGAWKQFLISEEPTNGGPVWKGIIHRFNQYLRVKERLALPKTPPTSDVGGWVQRM
jgi:hypothetical protein